MEAMALYRHVTNKDDIVDGIVDLVFAEIDLLRAPTGRPPCVSGRSRFAMPVTPPMGDRPDGVADQPRSSQPAPPRRSAR